MKAMTLTSLALMISASLGGATTRESNRPSTNQSEPRASLLTVLDVERESQAYYRAVLDKHRPFHPFGMVYQAERRHEQVLVTALEEHSFAVPEGQSVKGAIAVPEDRSAVLAEAVELEQKTVAAYDNAIKEVRSGDLRHTLERLRAESADHERWFGDPNTCTVGGGRGRPRNR